MVFLDQAEHLVAELHVVGLDGRFRGVWCLLGFRRILGIRRFVHRFFDDGFFDQAEHLVAELDIVAVHGRFRDAPGGAEFVGAHGFQKIIELGRNHGRFGPGLHGRRRFVVEAHIQIVVFKLEPFGGGLVARARHRGELIVDGGQFFLDVERQIAGVRRPVVRAGFRVCRRCHGCTLGRNRDDFVEKVGPLVGFAELESGLELVRFVRLLIRRTTLWSVVRNLVRNSGRRKTVLFLEVVRQRRVVVVTRFRELSVEFAHGLLVED